MCRRFEPAPDHFGTSPQNAGFFWLEVLAAQIPSLTTVHVGLRVILD
jgi:hypothetical protein